VTAALLWLPQAGLLAWAVQRLADGRGVAGVLVPAAGVLALGLLRAVCEGAALRRLFDGARAEIAQLRAQLGLALARRSPLDGARASSGLAASAMAEQADALAPQLLRYVPARWRVACVPLAIVVAVAPLSWVAALILVATAPLIPLFMALVGWRAKAASEAQLAGLGDMHGFLLDRLRGLATLRALGAVETTALRLRASAELLRQRTMAVLRVAFLSSAVLELFSALGVAMVAVYVGFHLLGALPFGAWGGRLCLGEGVFILLLAPAFFEPLRELSAAWHDRAAGEAARQSIVQWSAPAPTLLGASQGAACPAGAGAVALRVERLRFTHAGAARPLFDGLSFALAPGEQLAVVGASGAGKSTLLALLAGLAPADGGHIAIDGMVLGEATAAGLRARMAWVAQAPHVFTGSVRHNLLLGGDEVPAAAVGRVLAQAAFASAGQPALARAIGEGGAGLSGGELVRLALARASLQVGAGLVLADEPTAHLDRATADAVIDALLQLAEGRTLVVATHDPVLLARLPRHLVLGAAA
jgi:ATP-binding cassette subfamily C protein CydD